MTDTSISTDAKKQPGFAQIVLLFSDLSKEITKYTKGAIPPVGSITLREPPPHPPIHAFYTAISWFYVCVIEAGALHFPFLTERASALKIDTSDALRKFREDVTTFRTILQHNLDLSDPTDAAKLAHCEMWMATALNRAVTPAERFWPNDTDWGTLFEKLCHQAAKFAEINLATIIELAKDPFGSDVVAMWAIRCTRCIPAFKFDRIAQEAATDLGLEFLDVVRLRKNHLEKWNRQLRFLQESLDIEAEARKVVEATLLNEAASYLPISGTDVICELGVKPGPEVKRVLDKAREIYRQTPCTCAELMRKLKELQMNGTLS